MLLKQAIEANKRTDPEKTVGFWQMILTHHEGRMKGLEHDPNGYRYHQEQAEHAKLMIERLRSKSA